MIWIAIAALALHNIILELRLNRATTILRALIISIIEDDDV